MPHFLKNPMWKPGKSQNFNFSMFLPSNYQAVSIPMTMLLRTLFRSFRSQPIPIISEAVFSSSNPLVGRLRILGFVVETDGCGARLGRRRTRLFLACFLSHFRKRRSPPQHKDSGFILRKPSVGGTAALKPRHTRTIFFQTSTCFEKFWCTVVSEICHETSQKS